MAPVGCGSGTAGQRLLAIKLLVPARSPTCVAHGAPGSPAVLAFFMRCRYYLVGICVGAVVTT